ncbi:hypothetical protein K7432_014591 [Basidiobolus ranarum]|uniref:Uncharacterized protein n=1 Tax=Basidiobolus ranarum TaxID=34480 RepID=A0ABR2VP96_9FUNG
MIQSLTAAYHTELVDSVIWRLMNTHADELNGIIHTSSTTRSGAIVYQEHYLEDMQRSRHPFIHILERVPQRSVPKHKLSGSDAEKTQTTMSRLQRLATISNK